MKFHIWMEGYAATGESGGYSYVGVSEGKTFLEACKNYAESNFTWKYDGNFKVTGKHASYWGCRLYPTREQAFKNFG